MTEQYPPPGWQPAGDPGASAPPPGWQPPAGGSGPAPYPVQPGYPPPPPMWGEPGRFGAAHKPGAVPLRPLGLGDVFDAAFRILRFNPAATVGAAALVAAVTMLIPVVVTGVLTFGLGVAIDTSGESLESDDVVGGLASLFSLAGGFLLLQIGLVLVSGMVAHTTMAAATGRRLDLAQAWAATAGRRLRLFGLILTTGVAWFAAVALWAALGVAILAGVDTVAGVLFLVLTGLFGILPGSVLYWVRVVYLSPAVLMLEQVGIGGAIRRAVTLTRGQFWRIFGIALLVAIVAGIGGNLLAAPFGIAGQLATLGSSEQSFFWVVATQALSSVVSSAFTAPFTGAAAALLYLDQRIRKEAFDVELMRQAGLLGP